VIDFKGSRSFVARLTVHDVRKKKSGSEAAAVQISQYFLIQIVAEGVASSRAI
jgi:hypothetical protein